MLSTLWWLWAQKAHSFLVSSNPVGGTKVVITLESGFSMFRLQKNNALLLFPLVSRNYANRPKTVRSK